MVRPALRGDTEDISSNLRQKSGVERMTDDKRFQDGKSGSSDRNPPNENEAALSARLNTLSQRLSKVQGDRKVETGKAGAASSDTASRASAMAVGLRLSSELVAAVVVGAVIGWSLDRVLSISPWGMIIFLLLGFVAGVMNVMRSAGVSQK
jgi:ATP synthase protein I